MNKHQDIDVLLITFIGVSFLFSVRLTLRASTNDKDTSTINISYLYTLDRKVGR